MGALRPIPDAWRLLCLVFLRLAPTLGPHDSRRSRRSDPRLVLGPVLALVLPCAGALAQNAPAQVPAGAQPAPARQAPGAPAATQAPAALSAPRQADTEAIKQRDQELDAIRADERVSAENQAKLRREIETIGEDRRTLNQQLIDSAARVRDVEASIDATRGRLKPLDAQETALRKSLDERRSAIVEILAALQRAGHQPPPALLVQPEDALKAVRTAITLGAILPDMRSQADAISGDLADLLTVRKAIVSENEHLAHDRDVLGREQLRMNLLIDERQKKQSQTEEALEAERARAAELARQADTSRTSSPSSNQRSIRRRATRMPRLARSKRMQPARRSPRSRIRAGSRRRSLSPPCAGICSNRLTVRKSATSAAPTASVEPRRGNRLPLSGRPDYLSLRRLGGLRWAVSQLWPTLDPECRWRVSCFVSGDGADLRRSWPVRFDW